MSDQKAVIVKQMEYYMGDKNLAKDDFFRNQILLDKKEGYISMDTFQKCNAIKKLGVTNIQIKEACKDSKDIEFNKDGSKVRRVGNSALPAQTGSLKKRETKAGDKADAKKVDEEEKKVEEDDDTPLEKDALGRIVFQIKDFENTHIIHFATADKDEAKDDEYKVNWKSIEIMIKEKFDLLKVVYTRADKYEGDIAISSFKLNKAQFEKLKILEKVDIDGKTFDFTETSGEVLKDFWQAQGNHFQFCIAPKLRAARKNQKKANEVKREEKAKRQKVSFTIAGIHYMDINKVKSKSRAILNIRRDGEKLDKADEDFMKEILRHHHKYEEKSKDFEFFEVGPHPEFLKTRCFFVCKTGGKKEDFSVSKCINNLEQQACGDFE